VSKIVNQFKLAEFLWLNVFILPVKYSFEAYLRHAFTLIQKDIMFTPLHLLDICYLHFQM